MLTAVSWTHPMHGEVTEVLCASHEPPARAALRELGIEYTWRLVSDGPCHRCDQRRRCDQRQRWHHQRQPQRSAR
jgi:hypothetical protein